MNTPSPPGWKAMRGLTITFCHVSGIIAWAPTWNQSSLSNSPPPNTPNTRTVLPGGGGNWAAALSRKLTCPSEPTLCADASAGISTAINAHPKIRFMKSTPVGKSLLGTGGLVQRSRCIPVRKAHHGDVEGHGEKHTVFFFGNSRITLQS